jgi:hypothetical protein
MPPRACGVSQACMTGRLSPCIRRPTGVGTAALGIPAFMSEAPTEVAVCGLASEIVSIEDTPDSSPRSWPRTEICAPSLSSRLLHQPAYSVRREALGIDGEVVSARSPGDAGARVVALGAALADPAQWFELGLPRAPA